MSTKNKPENSPVNKPKVYLLMDYASGNYKQDARNIGIEFMGNCGGRIVSEDGTLIGNHHSSSIGWLRSDLLYKLDNPENYEIVDLIEQEVPEKFRLAAREEK